MKIIMLLLIFLLVGAFFIISQNNLSIKEPENLEKFTLEYSRWITGIFDKTKGATGYIIRLDWLPPDQNE